jgi:hypothetical protein
MAAKRLLRLWRDESALAAIEFALLSPLFMTMFYGSVEMTRYVHIHQKLEKAVFQMADIVSQSSDMTTGTLDDLVDAMDHIMDPYEYGPNSRVVITSVSKEEGESAKVRWQYCGGDLLVVSALGDVDDIAELPGDFDIDPKEDVIVAEFFYRYEPFIDNPILDEGTVYKYAIYRPRLGALDDFVSDCGA